MSKKQNISRSCVRYKKVSGDAVKDVQKIGKSTLGKKDDKIVGNENIDLEGIYARLGEASFF